MKSILIAFVTILGLCINTSTVNAQPRQPQRPVVVVQPVVRPLPVFVQPVFVPRLQYGYTPSYYNFNYSYGFNSYGQSYGFYNYSFYQQNRFGLFWGW